MNPNTLPLWRFTVVQLVRLTSLWRRAIPRRRTDRRHCQQPASVPSHYLALMGARAARAGVMLRQSQALPRLQSIVAQAVWRHATDLDYLTELTTWSGRYASLAGVPAHNAPESDRAAPIPPPLFAWSCTRAATRHGLCR